MSDTPKKPSRKKAAPKDDAPKAPGRDDAALREAVLMAALPHAAFDGFIDSVLDKAGKDAGVSKQEIARLFEGGPAALVEFYSVWADDRMERALAGMDLKAMKIRMRIAAAVWARLDALKPHKEAARRAAAMLSLPMNAPLGAKLMYRTVDAMWRAVATPPPISTFIPSAGFWPASMAPPPCAGSPTTATTRRRPRNSSPPASTM